MPTYEEPRKAGTQEGTVEPYFSVVRVRGTSRELWQDPQIHKAYLHPLARPAAKTGD